MQEAGWASKKFLIDGYPRNDDNVQGWAEIIGDSAQVAKVLYFEVSDKTMGDRIAERSLTGQRNDDNPETLRKRGLQFQNEQMPVIQEYEKMGLVAKLDGNKTEEQVFQDVKDVLADHLPAKKKKIRPNCLRENEFFVMVDNAGH